jgi:hypothetical protein
MHSIKFVIYFEKDCIYDLLIEHVSNLIKTVAENITVRINVFYCTTLTGGREEELI